MMVMSFTTFLLMTVSVASAKMTCITPENHLPFLQFCSAIDYQINGPTADAAHSIDQIAKQTFVHTLHMHGSCGGKIVSKKCSIAFRKYTCAYHFPRCVNTTATKPIHLLPPCREVCEHYCSTCNMASCPCYDLPINAAEGKEKKCQTLEE